MYELTGKIADLSLDFRTGRAKLTLELNERQSAANMFDELNQCEKLSIKISKHREKRSLDANAYFFVLLMLYNPYKSAPSLHTYSFH